MSTKPNYCCSMPVMGSRHLHPHPYRPQRRNNHIRRPIPLRNRPTHLDHLAVQLPAIPRKHIPTQNDLHIPLLILGRHIRFPIPPARLLPRHRHRRPSHRRRLWSWWHTLAARKHAKSGREASGALTLNGSHLVRTSSPTTLTPTPRKPEHGGLQWSTESAHAASSESSCYLAVSTAMIPEDE